MNNLNFDGLLGPQKEHARNLLDSLYLNGIAMDTSETGCGKTYVASWIAKNFGAPVIVICPKVVMPSWGKILGKFDIVAKEMVNYELLVRGGTPHLKYRENKKDDQNPQPRYFRTVVKFPMNSLIIVDEIHKCKGVSSLNGGLAIALKRQGYNVIGLSATMATNSTEMRATGYMMNLHNLYDWKAWCLENGAKQHEFRDFLTFDAEDTEAQKKMAQCHHNMVHVQKICSRLTRDMMGALFPENQVIADAYDLGANTAKIQAVYDEMENEIAKLEDSTENYSVHVFAEMMKARRKSELLKIPLFMEMIEDLYDENKSVVVFLNFTETIEIIAERLDKHPKFKGKIGFVYGNQTMKKRIQDVDDFQSDKKRILLCNLRSGGAALSLHDLNGKHARASLISPSFSAVDMLQALGRIHRLEGKSKAHQRIVYAAGCIEERACHKVQLRLNNLSCLVDGDLMPGFRIFN